MMQPLKVVEPHQCFKNAICFGVYMHLPDLGIWGAICFANQSHQSGEMKSPEVWWRINAKKDNAMSACQLG